MAFWSPTVTGTKNMKIPIPLYTTRRQIPGALVAVALSLTGELLTASASAEMGYCGQ
jgi:hypothetical protein